MLYKVKPDVWEFPTERQSSTHNSWTRTATGSSTFFLKTNCITHILQIIHWALQVFIHCCLCRNKDTVKWCDVMWHQNYNLWRCQPEENLDNEDSSWWLSSLIWSSTLSTIRFWCWNSVKIQKSTQHDQISAKIQSDLSSVLYFLVELVFKHQEYTSWHTKQSNVLIILFMIFRL